MSYDFDGLIDRSPPETNVPVPASDDLEALVMLLDLAAIDLTHKRGDTFTFDELFAKCIQWGCGEIVPEERDVRIVFNNSGKRFKREGAGRYSMR